MHYDVIQRFYHLDELEERANSLGVSIPELNAHRLIIAIGFVFYINTLTRLETLEKEIEDFYESFDNPIFKDNEEWNQLNNIIEEFHEVGFGLY